MMIILRNHGFNINEYEETEEKKQGNYLGKEKLTSAKVLLDAGLYKDSVGRSYYAIFSSIRAILATRQVDFSKHAGVIS